MKKSLLAAGFFLALTACSHPPVIQPKTVIQKQPDIIPIAKAPANFMVVTYEVVARADDDTQAKTAIYADGQPIGETETAPKSKRKNWEGTLSPGNHLIRCERWLSVPSTPVSISTDTVSLSSGAAPSPPMVLASTGTFQWTKDNSAQPWERFVRIEDGRHTKLEIKYFNDGREFTYEISKEPMRELPASPPSVNPASIPPPNSNGR